jgi:hypothetical protein
MESGCRSYVRHFHFDKVAGSLEVTDKIELAMPGPVETALITEYPVVLRDGNVEIQADGLTLLVTPLGDTVVDRVEKHGYSTHHGQPAEVKRVVFIPAANGAKIVLAYVATVVA